MAKRFARFLLIVSLIIPAAGVSGQVVSYTIRDGETLFGIAKKVKVPMEVLCAFNGIGDPGRVKAGTTIRVPEAYTVKKGDTLFSIAKTFSVSLSELLSLNKLRDNSSIKAGERLFVPGDQRKPDRVAADPKGASDPKAGANPPSGASTAGGTASEGGSGQASPSIAAKPGIEVVWPHAGKREPWIGKVTGLIFHGAEGDPVVSASAGEVKWVAPYWGWGKTVIIKNDDGLLFIYAGNEELLVNVGDRVKPGIEIAKLGVSPQGGGAKLYFCIEAANGQTIDAEKYFSRT